VHCLGSGKKDSVTQLGGVGQNNLVNLLSK